MSKLWWLALGVVFAVGFIIGEVTGAIQARLEVGGKLFEHMTRHLQGKEHE